MLCVIIFFCLNLVGRGRGCGEFVSSVYMCLLKFYFYCLIMTNKLHILLKLGAEHVLPQYRILVPLLPEIFSQAAIMKIKLDISQISY